MSEEAQGEEDDDDDDDDKEAEGIVDPTLDDGRETLARGKPLM